VGQPRLRRCAHQGNEADRRERTRVQRSNELALGIAASAQGERIELLVQPGKHQREVTLSCSKAHRYPHLKPVPGVRPRLDEILPARR
jgi:hypothetical protein